MIVQENVKSVMPRLVELLQDMKTEGECIREELDRQMEAFVKLNEDIEQTKNILLEIQVTITLTSMQLEME